MSLYRNRIFLFALCFLISGIVFSQDTTVHRQDTVPQAQDTLRVSKDSTKRMMPVDSIPKVATQIISVNKTDSVLKAHSPKKAAIRSAILPGLGQVYNKKYWKIPIIYGALGIAGAVFAYNLTNYKALRIAYRAKYNASLPVPDSSEWSQIRYDLLPIDMNALRSYRDEFRRNIDYSVLAIMVLWGLNVVDATVDAHLKPFDVSPDLTMRFRIGPSLVAGTTGLSLVFDIHGRKGQMANGKPRYF
ncbi:MAG: DUF5683 domain-containing protein [Flavisolibacter sp.]